MLRPPLRGPGEASEAGMHVSRAQHADSNPRGLTINDRVGYGCTRPLGGVTDPLCNGKESGEEETRDACDSYSRLIWALRGHTDRCLVGATGRTVDEIGFSRGIGPSVVLRSILKPLFCTK